MTPHSLAFHVDVVTTGTVLGAGPADSPARVAEILGPAFAENTFGDHSMCRDYGLTEFYWDRAGPDHPWSGHHFTVQVEAALRQLRSAAWKWPPMEVRSPMDVRPPVEVRPPRRPPTLTAFKIDCQWWVRR
ncbi:hypothetical protein AB0G86_13620 [Streptomyces scabiei]|uniref:hypothetical protein n=1 Tax=Streptomyces scabiei TaxID=1930 RepID=UPI0033E9A45A